MAKPCPLRIGILITATALAFASPGAAEAQSDSELAAYDSMKVQQLAGASPFDVLVEPMNGEARHELLSASHLQDLVGLRFLLYDIRVDATAVPAVHVQVSATRTLWGFVWTVYVAFRRRIPRGEWPFDLTMSPVWERRSFGAASPEAYVDRVIATVFQFVDEFAVEWRVANGLPPTPLEQD